jgi:hypothetical protein
MHFNFRAFASIALLILVHSSCQKNQQWPCCGATGRRLSVIENFGTSAADLVFVFVMFGLIVWAWLLLVQARRLKDRHLVPDSALILLR